MTTPSDPKDGKKPAPWKLPKEHPDAPKLFDQVKGDETLVELITSFGRRRLAWLETNDRVSLNAYLNGGTLTLHLLQVGHNAATQYRRRLRANVPPADADKEVADTIVAPRLEEAAPTLAGPVEESMPGKIEAWKKSKPAALFLGAAAPA